MNTTTTPNTNVERFKIQLTRDLPIAEVHGASKGAEFEARRTRDGKGMRFWGKANQEVVALPGEYKVVEYDSGIR